MATSFSMAASITFFMRSGVQSASYCAAIWLGQEGGVGVDVDGLVHHALDAVDVHLHEGLRVGEVAHLFRDPEAAAVAVVVAEGHGVGEAVVEAGDGFGRGEGHPLAAFALQSHVAGLALHGLEVVVDAVVVVHREAEAAVDGDAVVDAEAARVGESLLEGEAALQVHVVVDHRIVLRAEAHGFAVEVVDHGLFVRGSCAGCRAAGGRGCS